MDALLAKLSEQQAVLARQKTALSTGSDEENIHPREGSSGGSTLLTPASESFSNSQANVDRDANVRAEAVEVARLKRELDAAKDRIARQNQELNQSRIIKQTLGQTIGSGSDLDLSPRMDHLSINDLNGPYPAMSRQGWGNNDDIRSEISDMPSPPGVWSNPTRPPVNVNMQSDSAWGFARGRPFNQRGTANLGPMVMSQHQSSQQRNYSVPASPPGSAHGRGMSDFNPFNNGRGFGHLNAQSNRNSSIFGQHGNGIDMYAGSSAISGDSVSLGGMNPGSAFQNMGMYRGYQPQPIGTPLSPTANEFRSSQATGNPWNTAVRTCCFSGFAMVKTNIIAVSIVAWTDIRVTNGASELSSPPRPLGDVQLEVHCRQDRL